MFKKVLILIVLCGISLYAMPQSPHPYPNDYNKTEKLYVPGAVAIEIMFCAKTEVEQDNDFIIVMDAKKEIIGKFTGKSLAGQNIRIEGNTAYIQLITDDAKVSYGYSLEKVRSIYTRQYGAAVEIDYSSCSNLNNDNLKDELYNLIKKHTCLGYKQARVKMFSQIDNVNGYVRCVYTAREVKTNSIPDGNNMNCEHTWPKSKGAGSDPAKSDLYHLYPTDSKANSRRSSYPFGNVVSATWSQGGSSLGKSSSNQTVFMPREDHRGNVARSIFYFSVKYRKSIPSYEEKALKEWHKADPVDSKEMQRNNSISSYQKNRNPFIDHPEYVDKIEDF